MGRWAIRCREAAQAGMTCRLEPHASEGRAAAKAGGRSWTPQRPRQVSLFSIVPRQGLEQVISAAMASHQPTSTAASPTDSTIGARIRRPPQPDRPSAATIVCCRLSGNAKVIKTQAALRGGRRTQRRFRTSSDGEVFRRRAGCTYVARASFAASARSPTM